MEKLSAGIRAKLPKYAQPLFIRLVKRLDLTGTYKLTKKPLKDEGFDVGKVKGDPIYFKTSRDKSYRPLTSQTYLELINSARIGLAKL